MADLLQDFEKFFISKGIITSAYLDTMEEDPDSAVAIYEYSGNSGIAQDPSVHRSIQIVARAKKVKDAKATAKALYDSLVTEDHILNLTPERWTHLILRQPPFKIKTDESGRAYYGFNAGVTTYSD